MVEHNTTLDRLGKKWLPEGHALDVDRGFKAEDVVTDINKWKTKTDRLDLKGFDTPSAKEPTSRQVRRKLSGRTSGDDAMVEEPDRFVRQGTVTRQLIDRVKHKIYNFESFKKWVSESYKNDDGLWNLIEKGDPTEGGFQALFNTPYIQSLIKQNASALGISFIKKKHHVEQKRAERIWYSLSPQTREKAVRVALRQRYGTTELKILQRKVSIPRIRQRAGSGTTYYRVKPVKWTSNQVRFVSSRRGLSSERVLEEYNSFFSKPRTISSNKK